MKKTWIIGYFVIVIVALAIIAFKTISVDPFFHYHAPNTDAYFYPLNNERSQNNGITKHFEYEGIITGTSMTENFKTSEAETLFGVKFIKVPYSGGSYNEINRNLEVAASHNPRLKYIIRGLDMEKYFDDKDLLRHDMGTYPIYLNDDNLFNDVEYLFNRDVIFSRIYPMTKEANEQGFVGGITSFDSYANWMSNCTFGHKKVLPNGMPARETAAPVGLSQDIIDTIRGNIRQNVTAMAEKYPNITFYYFFTPYSAAHWNIWLAKGVLDRQIEAERIVVEEILKCDNIKLFSVNCCSDITYDLNNYKDDYHYGEWINSLLLRYMYEGKYQVTRENYERYLEEERQLYKYCDYSQLVDQEDYPNDDFAVALLRHEIYGVEPYHIDLEKAETIELSSACIESNQYDGQAGIVCTGRLDRPVHYEVEVSEYLRDYEYIGAKIRMPDMTQYKYLVFYGKKIANHGQLTVRLYDENGREVVACDEVYQNLDEKWHRYVVDLGAAVGPCTLILNGGYIDVTGNKKSQFVFSNITLY